MGETIIIRKDLIRSTIEKRRERERRLSEAYDWAEEWRKRHGILTSPIRMTFNNGDYVDNGDGFTISIFYDKSTGRALLRRDWEDEMAVQYNDLVNFDEIAKIAPKSVSLMLKNGLKVKKIYDELDEH